MKKIIATVRALSLIHIYRRADGRAQPLPLHAQGDGDHDVAHQYAQIDQRLSLIHILYRDFRPGFRQGQQEARELGLYMQKYCGCVFSEEDRSAKQISRDMQAPERCV